MLETLDLAGIPLRVSDRAEGDPIVLAGGPCAYNPEPYAPFFDVILVGEGEEQLPEVLALIRELRASGAPRAEILRVGERPISVCEPCIDRQLGARTVEGDDAFARPRGRTILHERRRRHSGRDRQRERRRERAGEQPVPGSARLAAGRSRSRPRHDGSPDASKR